MEGSPFFLRGLSPGGYVPPAPPQHAYYPPAGGLSPAYYLLPPLNYPPVMASPLFSSPAGAGMIAHGSPSPLVARTTAAMAMAAASPASVLLKPQTFGPTPTNAWRNVGAGGGSYIPKLAHVGNLTNLAFKLGCIPKQEMVDAVTAGKVLTQPATRNGLLTPAHMASMFDAIGSGEFDVVDPRNVGAPSASVELFTAHAENDALKRQLRQLQGLHAEAERKLAALEPDPGRRAPMSDLSARGKRDRVHDALPLVQMMNGLAGGDLPAMLAGVIERCAKDTTLFPNGKADVERLGELMADGPIIKRAKKAAMKEFADSWTAEEVGGACRDGGMTVYSYQFIHKLLRAKGAPVRVFKQQLADVERGMKTMSRNMLPAVRLEAGCGYKSITELQQLMAQKQIIGSGYIDGAKAVKPSMLNLTTIIRFDAFKQDHSKMFTLVLQMLTDPLSAHALRNISVLAACNGGDDGENLKRNLQAMYTHQLKALHFHGQKFDLMLKLPDGDTALVTDVPFKVNLFCGADALGSAAMCGMTLSGAQFDFNSLTTREMSRQPCVWFISDEGDTLASIAKESGLSIKDLRWLNSGTDQHQHRVNAMTRESESFDGFPEDFDPETHVRQLAAGLGDDDPLPPDTILVVLSENGEARTITNSPLLQFLFDLGLTSRLLWCGLHYRMCTGSSFILQLVKPIMDKLSGCEKWLKCAAAIIKFSKTRGQHFPFGQNQQGTWKPVRIKGGRARKLAANRANVGYDLIDLCFELYRDLDLHLGGSDLCSDERRAMIKRLLDVWGWVVRVTDLAGPNLTTESKQHKIGGEWRTLSDVDDYRMMCREAFLMHRWCFGADGCVMYHFWCDQYFPLQMEVCRSDAFNKGGMGAGSQTGQEAMHQLSRVHVKKYGGDGVLGLKAPTRTSKETDAEWDHVMEMHASFEEASKAVKSKTDGILHGNFGRLYGINSRDWIAASTMTRRLPYASRSEECYLDLWGLSDQVTDELLARVAAAPRSDSFATAEVREVQCEPRPFSFAARGRGMHRRRLPASVDHVRRTVAELAPRMPDGSTSLAPRRDGLCEDFDDEDDAGPPEEEDDDDE
jgi:hypothetical protein